MPAAAPHWAIVLESRGAGDVSFGPVLPLAPPECLDCLRQRRLAGAAPVGQLSLHPLSAHEYAGLHGTRFSRHQIDPAGGAQRFIPPNGCSRPCPSRQPAPPGPPLAVENCVGNRLGLVRRLEVRPVVTGTWTAIAYGAASIGSAVLRTVSVAVATAASTWGRRVSM